MSNHNASNQYKNSGNLVIDDEDRSLFENHIYQTKFKSIRWSYWTEKSKIKCYEAVLLTLGLDPEVIDYPSRVWATQLNSDDRNALDERIDNFKMLIGKGKLFESDVEENLGIEVKLKKVAEYLKKRNATLPTELLQLVSKNESNTISPPDHIKKLSLSDFFNVVQAACLISNDEAGKIQALIDSQDLQYNSWNYGEHTQAVETIKKGIKAKKLIQDADGDIPRASLQKFLFEKNHIIAGFNDNLPSQDQSTCGTPAVQQNEPNFDNLNTEITQLKDQLAQARQRIKELELLQHKEAVQAENYEEIKNRGLLGALNQHQEYVKQIEDKLSVENCPTGNLLNLIFDESATERYAQDLVLAIKAWHSVYIENPKDDSHANKVNNWLKDNSNYKNKESIANKRLREITMPTALWHSERNKNINNK